MVFSCVGDNDSVSRGDGDGDGDDDVLFSVMM
jgi:hypothetical protein